MIEDDGLAGKRVLIVEDDYLLAREICTALEKSGALILGPAPTVHYAQLILGRRKPDGAILDVRLFGQEVYELADRLLGDGIPILFATAYRDNNSDDRYRFVETLHKPICIEELKKSVAAFKPLPPELSSKFAPQGRKTPAAKTSPKASQSASRTDRWSRALSRVMSGARKA